MLLSLSLSLSLLYALYHAFILSYSACCIFSSTWFFLRFIFCGSIRSNADKQTCHQVCSNQEKEIGESEDGSSPSSLLSIPPSLDLLNTCAHECLLVLRDFDANLM